MDREPLAVKRLPVRLNADARLTITRLFWAGPNRAKTLINRIMVLDEEAVSRLLSSTMTDFGHLHVGLEDIFLGHFEQVARRVDVPGKLTTQRKLLMGAYFTLEYAFASAAMFNPSMTPAIDQNGVEPGSLRFTMSLRTVGEGHISSIIFRRGTVDGAGNIAMEPSDPYHQHPRRMESRWSGVARLLPRITRTGVPETFTETVLGPTGEAVTTEQLRRYLYRV